MRTLSILPFLATALMVAGCVSNKSNSQTANDKFGIMIMAHGGGDDWNQEVIESIAPIREQYPVDIAFGMADAGSIERSIRTLESQGVTHIGVVRLFVSGESWYKRTEQILGLREGAPEKSPRDYHSDHISHAMPMGFWRVPSSASFAMSKEGLAEADEMGRVLLSRAQRLSTNPANEDIVVLAHGPGHDAENKRWISYIDARAEAIRSAHPFHDVKVFTLREDWPEKREGAEKKIRDYVQESSAAGRTTLVLPFRVQGFGPYAEVLSGLPYKADELGLLPHTEVTAWIESQGQMLRTEMLPH